jgi:hypothetical protein
VNDWSAVFLAVIALATFTMAAIQVGAIIYAGRLSKRIERVISRLEGDVQPLLGRLTTVTADVARATSLAVAQMERLDKLGADFTRRAEDTIVEVQQAIVTPARESLAVLEGRAGRCGPGPTRRRIRSSSGKEPIDAARRR